jgi:ABC-type uncharacterized transport system involved in gliding motility auxiliary subunit
MPSTSSDLNRLTEAWGATLVAGQVVADLNAASQVGFGSGGSDRMSTWLSLRRSAFDQEDLSTSGLEMLMLPFAGGLEGEAPEGVTRTVLVSSSADASLVSSFAAMQPGSGKMRGATPKPNAPLVVRLTGRFPTAFPDGPPAAEDAEAPVEEEGLSEAAGDGVVVIVSDVDLLYDDYSLRATRFLGQTIYQPLNDNLSLVLNFVEQLTGNPALVGLRSRGRLDRPFDRVLALEKEAQEQWQQEEVKLQAKLQEAQTRLNELQRAKGDDQRFILSPEQKAEIEQFSAQRFEAQKQLREVRKNLRRDINRLGYWVKSINILAVPMLVAVFGVGYWWRRRSMVG